MIRTNNNSFLTLPDTLFSPEAVGVVALTCLVIMVAKRCFENPNQVVKPSNVLKEWVVKDELEQDVKIQLLNHLGSVRCDLYPPEGGPPVSRIIKHGGATVDLAFGWMKSGPPTIIEGVVTFTNGCTVNFYSTEEGEACLSPRTRHPSPSYSESSPPPRESQHPSTRSDGECLEINQK